MDGGTGGSGRRLWGPIAMTVVGVALVIAAVVIWFVAASRSSDVLEDAFAGRSSFDGEVAVPGELEVALDVGERRVYAVDEGGFTAPSSTESPGQDEPTPDLTVTVTGPDGEDVPVRDIHDELGFPDLTTGAILYDAAAFDVDVEGSYTVTVAVAPGSPPVDRAGVGPPSDFSEAIGEGFDTAALLLMGVVIGVIGMAVLIGGIVWLALAGSSRRRGPPPPGSWPPPPGGWGYGGPQPGHPPPSQWQQPSGSWGPPPGQWGPH